MPKSILGSTRIRIKKLKINIVMDCDLKADILEPNFNCVNASFKGLTTYNPL
jgi:hypothetical protein